MKYEIELTDEEVKGLHRIGQYAEPSSILKIIANQIPKPILDGIYTYRDFEGDLGLAFVKDGGFSTYIMPNGRLLDPERISDCEHTGWTRVGPLPDVV